MCFSGVWELQFEFRLLKRLNKESNDWELFSEGIRPELKFGMLHECSTKVYF